MGDQAIPITNHPERFCHINDVPSIVKGVIHPSPVVHRDRLHEVGIVSQFLRCARHTSPLEEVDNAKVHLLLNALPEIRDPRLPSDKASCHAAHEVLQLLRMDVLHTDTIITDLCIEGPFKLLVKVAWAVPYDGVGIWNLLHDILCQHRDSSRELPLRSRVRRVAAIAHASFQSTAVAAFPVGESVASSQKCTAGGAIPAISCCW
mmetsp:Transcript_43644/g.100691  ORF Transcript_43644/g.100691 Transcript_43644/m.100691 type:complete len:205 (+) Transcript_43644:808-1422(+)